MKCQECGTRVSWDQKFCTSCGSEVEFVVDESPNLGSGQESFKEMNTGSIINFDRMITPSIIKILFLVGVAVAAVLSITMAIFTGGFVGFLLGMFLFLVLVIVSRVNCEIIIVIFKIHESLVAIKNK